MPVVCHAYLRVAFDDDTGVRALRGDAWEGRIEESWYAGLGPLGGYVMAIVLRAIVLATDDEARQPRTMTIHFLRAPQAGPVTVRPAVERAGRSLTTVTAHLEQEGELMALALAALSAPRPGPMISEAPMPEVAPPSAREMPPVAPGRLAPPPFTQRVTMETRFGAPPFSGADRAEVGGWMGLREERPIDALTVALLADAWFPAPWPRLRKLAPAPTIELTVHFRAPLPLPDSLLLGRFRTRLVRDGFFDEDGELWTPDGTLVARSRQLGLLLDAEPG
jgi:acyl-coenzyme A thioesterase PaaI-like protein